jgi:hypothetical protein
MQHDELGGGGFLTGVAEQTIECLVPTLHGGLVGPDHKADKESESRTGEDYRHRPVIGRDKSKRSE